jgi:hypothetical protein
MAASIHNFSAPMQRSIRPCAARAVARLFLSINTRPAGIVAAACRQGRSHNHARLR